MSELLEKAELTELRELARSEDRSEEGLESDLKDLGFRRLTDFSDSSDQEKKDILYEISEMEKRKLQGIFGEKIAVFVEGKIKRYLDNKLPENWELKNKVRLRNRDENKSLRIGEKPETDGIKISGSNVSHFGAEKQEIEEKVRKRHFCCSDYIFQKFQEHRIPSIDGVMYAVKKSGDQKPLAYHLVDHSKSSAEIRRENYKIDLEEIEDFKIIGLEVKTTGSSPEELLSGKQRGIRDIAEESAFLELYTVKVDFEYSNGNIPDKVPVEIERLDI